MIKEQSSTVDSSMINKYVYNFTTKTLKVEFKGGNLYEYSNVDPDLYDNLCKAESIGKFFNEKIKNNFERHFLVENTLSQWHKVYKNYQTLQKHMTDNNVDYDHILVCRADFYAIPVFSKKQIETYNKKSQENL